MTKVIKEGSRPEGDGIDNYVNELFEKGDLEIVRNPKKGFQLIYRTYNTDSATGNNVPLIHTFPLNLNVETQGVAEIGSQTTMSQAFAEAIQKFVANRFELTPSPSPQLNGDGDYF